MNTADVTKEGAIAPLETPAEILIAAVAKWAGHVRGCPTVRDDSECADCTAYMNAVVLAHSVWERSYHRIAPLDRIVRELERQRDELVAKLADADQLRGRLQEFRLENAYLHTVRVACERIAGEILGEFANFYPQGLDEIPQLVTFNGEKIDIQSVIDRARSAQEFKRHALMLLQRVVAECYVDTRTTQIGEDLANFLTDNGIVL